MQAIFGRRDRLSLPSDARSTRIEETVWLTRGGKGMEWGCRLSAFSTPEWRAEEGGRFRVGSRHSRRFDGSAAYVCGS